MIVFLTPGAEEALALSEPLAGRRKVVDGPFRLWVGEAPDGSPMEVWHTPMGTDETYAAGLLAHRRGATFLVHLGVARAAPLWARDQGVRVGELCTAGRVADLRGLEAMQRLCPDSARTLPLELPAKPPRPLRPTVAEKDAGAPGLGSLAMALTCPLLADEIYERWGIGLFDEGAAGAAEAAFELSLPFLATSIVSGLVQAATDPSRAPMITEALRRDAARNLIAQFTEASQT